VSNRRRAVRPRHRSRRAPLPLPRSTPHRFAEPERTEQAVNAGPSLRLLPRRVVGQPGPHDLPPSIIDQGLKYERLPVRRAEDVGAGAVRDDEGGTIAHALSLEPKGMLPHFTSRIYGVEHARASWVRVHLRGICERSDACPIGEGWDRLLSGRMPWDMRPIQKAISSASSAGWIAW